MAVSGGMGDSFNGPGGFGNRGGNDMGGGMGGGGNNFNDVSTRGVSHLSLSTDVFGTGLTSLLPLTWPSYAVKVVCMHPCVDFIVS